VFTFQVSNIFGIIRYRKPSVTYARTLEKKAQTFIYK